MSTRLTLAIFVPFACVLVVLAQPLLTLWVGAAYANSTVLVLILTLARLFDISQWPAASVLTGMARHRPLAFISIGSGVVNLVLSLILVQRYGVVGVALGTLIPATLETLLLKLPLARREIGVSWRQVATQMFWPALGPAVPALLVLLALRAIWAPASLGAVAATGAAGLGVYAAVLPAVWRHGRRAKAVRQRHGQYVQQHTAWAAAGAAENQRQVWREIGTVRGWASPPPSRR